MRRDLARLHHVAVLAAQPDGLAAGGVDVADDLLVDRAGQHHLDDLDGRRVGDAQAAGEFRLDAELLEHGLDLRAAAMHHHRIDRGLLEQDDVAGEVARRLLLAHGVAAVFHDDDLLVVALHVRQRLGQDAGLRLRVDLGRFAHRFGLVGAGGSSRCGGAPDNASAPFFPPAAGRWPRAVRGCRRRRGRRSRGRSERRPAAWPSAASTSAMRSRSSAGFTSSHLVSTI